MGGAPLLAARGEGVAWSHAPVWKLGSLSRAVNSSSEPQDLPGPSSPPPQAWQMPRHLWVSWTGHDTRPRGGEGAGGSQGAVAAEKWVPVGAGIAFVPLPRRIISCGTRTTT